MSACPETTLSAGRLPEPMLQAVLWDMDGLLVDSEPLWTVAERELCRSWGVEFTAEVKAAMVGRRLDESVPILIDAAGVRADVEETGRTLLARVVELFATGLVVQPGAMELLDALAAEGVAQALVSSSFRVLVNALPPLLLGRFGATVAGDEVHLAKPHPDGYLAAAAGLGVDPSGCVVLEDSLPGAQAGAAAGARVVVVPSVAPVPAGPGWQLEASLTTLTPYRLRGLLAEAG